MAQDYTILMFANFLVLLANIHTPKPTQILPMPVVNLKKSLCGVVHAIFSIAYLEKQNKK
jgi:hypothetical protein